jgi:hypothetical protein
LVTICDDMSIVQPRENGRFGSPYKERRGEPISLRLPQSLDHHLRVVAGEGLKDWVEQAIREKLARS